MGLSIGIAVFEDAEELDLAGRGRCSRSGRRTGGQWDAHLGERRRGPGLGQEDRRLRRAHDECLHRCPRLRGGRSPEGSSGDDALGRTSMSSSRSTRPSSRRGVSVRRRQRGDHGRRGLCRHRYGASPSGPAPFEGPCEAGKERDPVRPGAPRLVVLRVLRAPHLSLS